ncbi:ATP-binding protein [Streptomyces sp. NPDC052042]|uniref:ATP-binding protein n=1 Tax=Streptomyces sp. NPDC052042 TaxID=3365683 RepID=UPI0037D1AFBB
MSAAPSLTAAWLHLAPVPSAVSCSRAFVTHTLRSWGCDERELTDSAVLILSELVTNAVKATGTMADPTYPELEDLGLIAVQIRAHEDTLFLEVWDSSPECPRAQAAHSGAESGRGLLLVEALSLRWGFSVPSTGGKIVYAELGFTGPGPQAPLEPLPDEVRRAIRTRPGPLHAMASAGLLKRLLVGLHMY